MSRQSSGERSSGEHAPSEHSSDEGHPPVHPRLVRATGAAGIVAGLAGCAEILTGPPTDPSEDHARSDDPAETGGSSPIEDPATLFSSDVSTAGDLAHGRGRVVAHEGALVIGDHSPAEIASRGPDEVRSQIPWYAPTFESTSARAAKTAISSVDPERILDAVGSMSVTTWRLTTQDGTRHVGPMAADFADALGIGGNDGSIATVDADGAILASLQGLSRRLARRNERLQAELDTLDAGIEALEARLRELEERETGGGAAV